MFILSIAHCLNWKKVIIGFTIVQFLYIILVHIKFGSRELFFYCGLGSLILFFPVGSIGISNMVKDLILTVHENKELVNTIKNILQVLPESVIVQSLDSNSQKVVLKYANDLAFKTFIEEDRSSPDISE